MQRTVGAVVLCNEIRKENDRLVYLLCENGSIIRAYASGARSPKNRLCAATEPFVFANFDLVSTSSGYSLTDAEITQQSFGLRGEPESYALAGYFAEVIRCLFSQDGNEELYPLFANVTYILSEKKRTPALVKAAAEFKLASLGGWRPETESCVTCGSAECLFFSIADGAVRCGSCGAEAQGFFKLDASVLKAIRLSCEDGWKKLFSFTLTGGALVAFSQISEAYLLYHTDMKFPALDYYRSLNDFKESLYDIRPNKTKSDT